MIGRIKECRDKIKLAIKNEVYILSEVGYSIIF